MTIAGSDLGFALGLPPSRAIRYPQGKGLLVTGGYRELLDEGHSRYFTVANVSKADVVADIHTELQRMLRNGGTLEQFKDQIIPRLKAKSWLSRDYSADELIRTGRLDAETGEIRKGLTPARLKTIFRTNMQSACMAGKYREFIEQADQRPYWQYVAVIDPRTRDTHAAMNGRVFRYDDPIGKVIWPPNDYNCRCSVRSYTERDIERRGLTVSSSAGKLSQVQAPQRDGSFITVTRYTEGGPAGVVFNPSPGFDSNPGIRFPQLDPGARRVVKELPGQITHTDLALPVLQSIADSLKRPVPALLPTAATRAAAADIVRDVLGLSEDNPTRLLQTPAGEVLLRSEYIDHIVEKPADARERFANFILPTLQDPFEVWLTMYDDGRPHRRYIDLYQTSKYDILVVVRVLTDGTVLWNLMHAQSRTLNRQRVGKLLFSKWGKRGRQWSLSGLHACTRWARRHGSLVCMNLPVLHTAYCIDLRVKPCQTLTCSLKSTAAASWLPCEGTTRSWSTHTNSCASLPAECWRQWKIISRNKAAPSGMIYIPAPFRLHGGSIFFKYPSSHPDLFLPECFSFSITQSRKPR